MLQNIVDFKAKSFLSEQNTSTIAYEVKAVRAMWDPSLSIPGTNRRGGWRCPTGTRYGGQITDRFGRSCGWGVARRIANQISDIGQRLENVDDARRGRRIARRERRILARLNPQGGQAGRLERGLRGVAERLDGGDTPSPRGARRRTVVARPPSVDTPEAPRELTPAPRPQRRRRAPNVRDSEQRRMDREIEQPGAPRTGEAPARPARRRQPARPRGEGNLRESEQRRMQREIEQPGAPRTGEAPARRRRRAVVEATKKPKAPTRQAGETDPLAVAERDLNEARDMLQMMRQNSAAPQGIRRQREKIVKLEEEVRRLKPPRSVVEPKVVKPRRPRANVDRNDIGALLDAESEERRNAQPKRRKPQPGNSDNAARSEELRQNRVAMEQAVLADAKKRQRAQKFGRKVDVDKILKNANSREYVNYLEERVFKEQRLQVINNSENFPSGSEAMRDKLRQAKQRIDAANVRIEKLQQAIDDGKLNDNDYIEIDGMVFNMERMKTLIADHRDGWREVADALESRPSINPNNAPAPLGVPLLENNAFDNFIQGQIPKGIDAEELEAMRAQWDAEEQPVDQVRRFFRRRIVDGDLGDPADLRERIAVNLQEIREAQSRMDGDVDLIMDGAAVGQLRADALNRIVVNGQDKRRRVLENEIMEQALQNVASESSPKPKTKPKTPSTPTPTPIPAGEASAPKKPNGADRAPTEIAYKPLEFKPAFEADKNREIEEKLLAVRNAPELAAMIAEIDKLKFNHGAEQQARLNDHHDALDKALNAIAGGQSVDDAIEDYLDNQDGTVQANAKIASRQARYDEEWRLFQQTGSNIRQLDQANKLLVREKVSLELRQRFEKDLKNALARKEQGFVINENDSNLGKITPDAVKAKIEADIDKAISKRGKKLEKYLKERYPEGGPQPKFKGMTPAKWASLTAAEKESYIREAYSHPVIRGANGKLYKVSVTSYTVDNGKISLQTSFDEIDANGRVLRFGIAGSSRTIYPGDPKKVYQATFFIRSDVDKAADLATIYNQTAFTYLKAIGIKTAEVGPAEDGKYVWARVGFKERLGGMNSTHYRRFEEALKFYKNFGPGGLISSDEQYIRVKKFIESGRAGRKYSHQDAIFLIDDGNIADKARREYIKHWFVGNAPLSGAVLSFSEQKIGARVR
jgi:Arc/MetJ-type ribon-helix-helix transcriptional regulator